jgi:hypothetical protein
MMRFLRTFAAALVAISFAAGYALAQTDATPEGRMVLAANNKRAPAPRYTGTHVYLLRGFMDVFSTGMNDLETKMIRRGIRASVHNHSEYLELAEAIGERHRRGIRENVVIIGHSLGANDAFSMAERLNDFGITVPLIITYDPTAAMSAGRNVSRVVNFYSSTNGWGTAISRGPGFRGSLSNIDLSRRGEMGHTDIDKSPALHSQSIGYVQSIGGSRSSTATAPKKEEKESDKESSTKPEAKSADAKDAAKETADKKESGDKKETAAKQEPANKDVAAKPASDAKPAVKDAATESAASTPTAKSGEKDASSAAKPAAVKIEASEKDAAAPKPAAAKTETAASKAHQPATSN